MSNQRSADKITFSLTNYSFEKFVSFKDLITNFDIYVDVLVEDATSGKDVWNEQRSKMMATDENNIVTLDHADNGHWVGVYKQSLMDALKNNQNFNYDSSFYVSTLRDRTYSTSYRYRVEAMWSNYSANDEKGRMLLQPSIVIDNGKMTFNTDSSIAGVNLNMGYK